ncbi:hypothetical protein V5739_03215 [Salinimicrobium sp. TIG7-5_MAKvit]|uniref:hypothetical protein n=1 Tax=Salinimicrobium sp. TIG7-5_MAKvit TaxID=3121289 RepID=UPI003C6DBC87
MKNIYLLFSICLAAFLLNMALIKLAVDLPEFFTSHLNDLLCMPIVLSICLFIIRSFSRNKGIKISLFSACSLAALYSVYFELYLPDNSTRYTSDVIDVILYFLGAFAFWLVQGMEAGRKSSAIKKAT